MFSRAVDKVSGTRIFARLVGDGRQALVYSMTLVAREPVAMCLPLPVAAGAGEDAVRFVDLSGYPEFFADCERLFPQPRSFGLAASRAQPLARSATLAVHAVGDFVASYVPSPRDFARLDPRFRLPAHALAKLPAYADYGFAVFQLARERPAPVAPKRRWWQLRAPAPVAVGDAGGEQTIHPMAFTFPTRHADALYFPTLHLHDGDDVPAEATYDHALYCQTDDPRIARTFAWRASDGKLGREVDAKRAAGLVDGGAGAFKRELYAVHKNVDHLIEPPRCAVASLAVREPMFAFELAGTAAYYTEAAPGSDAAKRQATARTRLDDVSRTLAAGCRALVAARGGEWGLAPLPADLDAHAVSLANGAPMIMTATGPIALEPGSGRDLVIRLGAETARVERQSVAFAFHTAPARDTLRAIEGQLAAILDRV